tara:strand:+ start:131 stop:376 length:246 start_codon:yes stop_codon:yes gene_type:complete
MGNQITKQSSKSPKLPKETRKKTAKKIHINISDNLRNRMDQPNQKAVDILNTEGNTAFVKHCFNPTGKKQLTYAEMRGLYG